MIKPNAEKCCARLRSFQWPVQCSQRVSVFRAGFGFCKTHDPGASVTATQAAELALMRDERLVDGSKLMTQLQVKTGDRARLIKIPDDIVDDDLKEIFEQCVGHVFPVGDVTDTLVDLEIGDQFGRKSYMESIYVEFDCIEVIH